MPYLPKGHIFQGPSGEGYVLTRDVEFGDYMYVTDFEPFGGAPIPVEGEVLPVWLNDLLYGKGGSNVAVD